MSLTDFCSRGSQVITVLNLPVSCRASYELKFCISVCLFIRILLPVCLCILINISLLFPFPSRSTLVSKVGTFNTDPTSTKRKFLDGDSELPCSRRWIFNAQRKRGQYDYPFSHSKQGTGTGCQREFGLGAASTF